MISRIAFAPAALAAALVSCENPADQTTDAEVGEAVDPAASEAGDVRYVIADESAITFVGSKVTGSHDGGFEDFAGHFTVDESGEVNGGSIVIGMDSTWSDTDKLTTHLKSEDFFWVEEHPESTFTVTGVEKSGGSDYKISGNLDLRGVTKNITFPATASKDGETVKIDAEFDINRREWDINYDGKANDLIRDEVVIRFDLTARPEAGGAPV